MEKKSNTFTLVLTGVFGFFILLGLIAFSTYKSNSPTSSNVDLTAWGTIEKSIFDNYINEYKQTYNIDFKLTYTYKSLDTIDSELVEAIATGKSPDIILIPHTLEKRY
jgi:maltose-binding protein MalE